MTQTATLKNKKSTLSQGASVQNTTKTANSGGNVYLTYYGARYLDPKTSRWLSGDPALGEYIPVAPNSDQAKKHNQNLPGMGGVYNLVNLHVYHYGGNNPVKYVDPDGRNFYNFSDPNHTYNGRNYYYVVKPESGNEYELVNPGERYKGKIDGVIIFALDENNEIIPDSLMIIKVTGRDDTPTVKAGVRSNTVDGQQQHKAFIVGTLSAILNSFGDLTKSDEDLSGIYEYNNIYGNNGTDENSSLQGWVRGALSKVSESIDIQESGGFAPERSNVVKRSLLTWLRIRYTLNDYRNQAEDNP